MLVTFVTTHLFQFNFADTLHFVFKLFDLFDERWSYGNALVGEFMVAFLLVFTVFRTSSDTPIRLLVDGMPFNRLRCIPGPLCLLIPVTRFFWNFREVQRYFSEVSLHKGMLEILPGITQARVVAQGGLCLQFTGSSAMYRALVSKAYDLGNFGLQHVGEVCVLSSRGSFLTSERCSNISLNLVCTRACWRYCLDITQARVVAQGGLCASILEIVRDTISITIHNLIK